MAKSIWQWQNLIDNAATSLSASSVAGDLSASNMASTIIGRRWRSSVLTAYGEADFGSNQSVDIVALRFPRDTSMPLTGSVRHHFDADGGTPGTGAAHDSGVTSLGLADGYGYHVYQLPSTISARYWRFTFDVSGVSFFDVGRAWAGTGFTPQFDIALRFADEWFDLSKTSQAERSGAQYVDERGRQRLMQGRLHGMSDAERATVMEFQRIVGTSKQFLLVRDPDNFNTETIIGRLATTTPITTPDKIHNKAFTIKESL